MTAPPPPRRLLQRLVDNGRVQPGALVVSWIGIVLGIAWILMHPVVTVTTGEPKSRGTYFSENALLVDTTTAAIGDAQAAWAKSYHKEYINLDWTDETGCELHSTCTHVLTWIESKLRAIPGVEVYRQEYSQHLYDAEYVNRTNIYGILRAAPLVDRKESLVLVAQYPNIPATSKNGFSAMSVGLAMLRYLDEKKWLAKDVVLLLTDGAYAISLYFVLHPLPLDGPNDGRDGYAPGVEAWLNAYHADPFATTALEMHAGLIRGAINLETSLDSHKYNAVRRPSVLVRPFLIPSTRCADISIDCDDVLTWLHPHLQALLPAVDYGDYVSRLMTLLRFMKTLATGPSGPHANFIHYNIDAITLSALHDRTSITTTAPLRLVHWMRSIETVVRAVSNLEEKFHQSFYLYLLPSTRTFVSIGEYYYPMVLVMLPLFAHTLFHSTNTGGLRTAFALASFAVAAALGSILLVLTTHLS
ncbi:hypothetical protein As57867_008043, partial [Aphanomyces stellatus]